MAIKIDKSKMVRNLARNTKLIQHIDKCIKDVGDFTWQYEYTPKEEDDAFHPSGHCTPSPWELYNYATDSGKLTMEAPADYNPDTESGPIQKNRQEGFSASILKTFQVGHFWHAYLQWIVEKKLEFCEPAAIERRGANGWGDMGFKRKEEPTYNRSLDPMWHPFHWVTGSADIAPCALPGFGDYLIDFKTMGSHDFKPMTAPKWAVGKWECQLNVYMDFFDIEKALIVGILKDSPHDFKEFEFHRNQELIDALYTKWHLVSECLDENVEPPEDEEIFLPLRGPVEA